MPRRTAHWIVYVVECRDGTLYTGVTTDLPRRVRQHDAGQGARYTRGRGPVRLLWSEPQPDHGAALRREAAIKRLPAGAKWRLVGRRSMRSAVRSKPRTID